MTVQHIFRQFRRCIDWLLLRGWTTLFSGVFHCCYCCCSSELPNLELNFNFIFYFSNILCESNGDAIEQKRWTIDCSYPCVLMTTGTEWTLCINSCQKENSITSPKLPDAHRTGKMHSGHSNGTTTITYHVVNCYKRPAECIRVKNLSKLDSTKKYADDVSWVVPRIQTQFSKLFWFIFYSFEYNIQKCKNTKMFIPM